MLRFNVPAPDLFKAPVPVSLVPEIVVLLAPLTVRLFAPRVTPPVRVMLPVSAVIVDALPNETAPI